MDREDKERRESRGKRLFVPFPRSVTSSIFSEDDVKESSDPRRLGMREPLEALN